MSRDTLNIIYDKHTKFHINPALDETTNNQLVSFLNALKTENNIFWTFEPQLGAIIINENTQITNCDIFDQLITIYHWLYNRGYCLKGSTCYRIDNFIEYISTDTLISHYILFDKININHIIMSDAKNKLLTQLKKSNKKKKKKNNEKIIRGELQIAKNRIKFLTKANMFLWQVCEVISCITFSSFLFYIAIEHECV